MRATPDQMDLLAAYAPPWAHAAPPPVPEPVLPPPPAVLPYLEAMLPGRPRRWMDLLARATHRDIRIEVSTVWSGTVVEVLSDPELGRHHLHHDGIVVPVCGDPSYGRQVWFTQHSARTLHRRHPLVLVARRDAWRATFRFSDPGDVPDDAALQAIDDLAQLSPLSRPRMLGEARHG